MSRRQNGAANLKYRHHVERCLAILSPKLALSFGCAGKGLSGVGRHCFYLALLIGRLVLCPGGVEDEPRQVALAGTARVATRAIEPIVRTQPSGPGRERACHSGGFHVHSGRATPII
jgi:hypothetical protein